MLERDNANYWIFNAQNCIKIVCDQVAKERSIVHDMNWSRFCRNVRDVIYAAKAAELSTELMRNISGESPYSLGGRWTFPYRTVGFIDDLKCFQSALIGKNNADLHKEMVQGNFA